MTMPVDLRSAPTRRVRVVTKEGKVLEGLARLLPVASLRIESRYQRSLDRRWVAKQAVYGWDAHAAQAISVNVRGGILWVVDGQHRVELARELGITHVWAIVDEGKTLEQEAKRFIRLQGIRRSLKSWDLWKAELAANDPDSLAIDRAVMSAGFRIAVEAGHGNIQAIETLRRVYRLGGADLLGSALGVVRANWTLEDKDALSGQVIEGLALFLHSYLADPLLKEDRLTRLLTRTAPTKLLRLAQAIATERSAFTNGNATNLAEALRDLYNDGLRPNDRLGPLTKRGRKLR